MIQLALMLALCGQAPATQAAPAETPVAAKTASKAAALTPEDLARQRANAEVIRLAELQERGEETGSTAQQDLGSLLGALFKMLAVLGVICLLAYFLLGKVLPRLMRVPMPTASQKLLTVVDRLPIDQKRTLLVVAVGEQHFLVGAADAGINLISRLDDETVRIALQNVPAASSGPLSVLRRTMNKEG